MKKYDEAIADYTKAIELKPADADAYRNRGITYNILQKYEEAIKDWKKAIELKPDYKSKLQEWIDKAKENLKKKAKTELKKKTKEGDEKEDERDAKEEVILYILNEILHPLTLKEIHFISLFVKVYLRKKNDSKPNYFKMKKLFYCPADIILL